MSKTAIVTGANKGIGFEIAKSLYEKGINVILACRNESLGSQAMKDIQGKCGDKSNWIVMKYLDISDEHSIQTFCADINNEFPVIDILVNNAAIAFKSSDPTPFADQAEPTIHVNFFGTLSLTQKLLVVLRRSSSPTIVNIASQAGHLRILPSQERQNFFKSLNLTMSDLVHAMNQFVNDVKAGTHVENGWPNSCYGTSKLGVIAMTKILARENPDMVINCCCPGFCQTDMSSHRGNRSAHDGSITPVSLALLPKQSPSGLFYFDNNELEW